MTIQNTTIESIKTIMVHSIPRIQSYSKQWVLSLFGKYKNNITASKDIVYKQGKKFGIMFIKFDTRENAESAIFMFEKNSKTCVRVNFSKQDMKDEKKSQINYKPMQINQNANYLLDKKSMMRQMMNCNTRPFIDFVFIIKKHQNNCQHTKIMNHIKKHINSLIKDGDRLTISCFHENQTNFNNQLQFYSNAQQIETMISNASNFKHSNTNLYENQSIDIVDLIESQMYALKMDRMAYLDSSERDVYFFAFTDHIIEMCRPLPKPGIPHFHFNLTFYQNYCNQQEYYFTCYNQNINIDACQTTNKVDHFLSESLKYVKKNNTIAECDKINNEKGLILHDCSDIEFEKESFEIENICSMKKKYLNDLKYMIESSEIEKSDYEKIMNINYHLLFENKSIELFQRDISEIQKKYFQKKKKQIIVIDTNVFLDFEIEYIFEKLKNHQILIPYAVMKELGNKLYKSKQSKKLKQNALKYLKYSKHRNIKIGKASLMENNLLESKGLKKRNDNRIFISSLIEFKTKQVTLLTSDVALSTKCMSYNILSCKFEEFVNH